MLIPTYNERDNIEALINRILNLNPEIRILVIDDNSSDSTGEIVDRLVKTNPRLSVLHRYNRRGRGSAGVTAFKYAIRQNVDCVIEMDADFSHDPKYIPELLKNIGDYDVVIGSRMVNDGRVVGANILRRYLSTLARVFCHFILGINIRDATSGFRCFKKRVLENIDLDNLRSTGPSIIEEVNLRIQEKGFKIKEIPIIFRARSKGRSKLNLAKVLDTAYTLLKIKYTL